MNLQQLPDLGSAFQQLRLREIISYNTHHSVFAQTCQANAYNDQQWPELRQMLNDQYGDNPDMIEDIFGKEAAWIIANHV
jgi:hypothetical protein